MLVRHALRAPSRFLFNSRGARYAVRADVIDFADLGVPQNRPRLIVLGIRSDLGIRPPIVPRPFRGIHRTVADALDVNPIPIGTANHEFGMDSEAVVERLKLIPPGQNYRAIPDGHPLAVKGLISHVYRRLDPAKPSYTVIAGGGGGTHGYHHIEPRRLSNRERARLQAFPDSFIFSGGGGKSSYANVRSQVGNAVPPVAAEVIVGALARALREAGVLGTREKEIQRARMSVGRAAFDMGSEIASA